MALRYEWTFDFAQTGGAAVWVTDEGGSFEARFTTGHYGHTSIATVRDIDGNTVSRYSSVTAFAAALQTELNAEKSGAGAYTVSYSASQGYTIAYDNGNITLSFNSGSLTSAAEGTHMRRILGMAGNRSGDTQYSSTVRPYYVIVPTIQGRSNVSDEMEPEGIASEAVADSGEDHQISRDSLEIHYDWQQTMEPNEAPLPFDHPNPGCPVFARSATATVPWTYQHAFRHARDGDQPFLVVDGSESAVHKLRAEGASFRPQRAAAPDYPLWTIPFATRLIGRIP